MIEKRKEARIPVEALPECLKTVVISTGLFQEYTAITVDATNYGIGFYVENINNKELRVGENINIKILPYNYKLKGKIIYTKNIGDNKIRFGIEFVKEKDLDKFTELLNLDIYK